ncbi:FISUMP domain-containing protein [Balneolaceae bacterium ANBcel3]|nr:FISUMP domain-containing protein [Balneolaceae bacterium ANBcel3]
MKSVYRTMPVQAVLLILLFLLFINSSASCEETGRVDFDTEVVEVFSPATGRTWMDRNLGASRVATSKDDEKAYGDLYQWGRPSDGHQKRNSPVTHLRSHSDQPNHGGFVSGLSDWRSPKNDNLWQGMDGMNNPCPAGYRLPTDTEWEAERSSWSSNNAAGAFDSPLKLPMAGGRRSFNNGSLFDVGSSGYYWSSTVHESDAEFLVILPAFAYMSRYNRTRGCSVRCIKD